MNYIADFSLDDTLFPIIQPELKQTDRSKIGITKDKNILKIHIESKDATAFRATINGLTKLLAVHEKTKKVIL